MPYELKGKLEKGKPTVIQRVKEDRSPYRTNVELFPGKLEELSHIKQLILMPILLKQVCYYSMYLY